MGQATAHGVRREPALLRRLRARPLASYYVLTFVLSWSAVLWAMASHGIPATKAELQAVLPAGIVSMLLGPSAAGLSMTAVMDGKVGLRELASRLLRGRASARWVALAALFAPLASLAVLLALSTTSASFLPAVLTRNDAARHAAFGLVAALVTGFCEELGWTGFALPHFRQRYSVLVTGLVMGVLWGLWHVVPMVVLACLAYSAPLSPALYVAVRTLHFLVGSLVPFRVLMVWVHERTKSLPVLMLMHASLTAASIVYEPEAISGTSLYLLDFVSGVVMWLALGVVAVTRRGQLVGDPAAR